MLIIAQINQPCVLIICVSSMFGWSFHHKLWRPPFLHLCLLQSEWGSEWRRTCSSSPSPKGPNQTFWSFGSFCQFCWTNTLLFQWGGDRVVAVRAGGSALLPEVRAPASPLAAEGRRPAVPPGPAAVRPANQRRGEPVELENRSSLCDWRCGLCRRFWRTSAPGISLPSLSATRRPVRASQWVSARKNALLLSFTAIKPWRQRLPRRREQARDPTVRGPGRQLDGVAVRPQFAPLLPQPAAASPQAPRQPHRAAPLRQPPLWRPASRTGCCGDHHAPTPAAGHFCQFRDGGGAGKGRRLFEGAKPPCISGKRHSRCWHLNLTYTPEYVIIRLHYYHNNIKTAGFDKPCLNKCLKLKNNF